MMNGASWLAITGNGARDPSTASGIVSVNPGLVVGGISRIQKPQVVRDNQFESQITNFQLSHGDTKSKKCRQTFFAMQCEPS